MRKILLVVCILSCTLVSQSQYNGQISNDRLAKIKTFHQKQDRNVALINAISNNSVSALALSRDHIGKTDHEFKYKVKVNGITNQKSSGRCWMFTGLNVLRPEVISRYNLTGFEFSTNYLYLFDLLEKSNLFLNSVRESAHEPITSKKVEWLLKSPVGDGGVWNSFTNLVEKYGLVPKSAMPETFHSEKTSTLNKIIKRKLREYALELRQMSFDNIAQETVEERETVMLSEIYHILVLHLGTPPEEFEWRFRDRDGLISEAKLFTPISYRDIVFPELKFDDYIMLMDDPTREYYKLYEIDLDRNVLEGKNWQYVNIPAEEIKKFAMESIKMDQAMYFSCDVGKQLESKAGILSINNYDFESLYGVKFGMNKRDRILTFESGSSHGMALVGVDVNEKEEPTKWLLENSWGEKSGNKGYLTMTDEWFDEYMFRVVVKKEFVSNKVLKILELDPIILPPWDPMFLPDR